MSLVINHNLMALNASRNLTQHYGKLSTSMRRLSSGLRVGIAADDAAGLAISELGKAKAAILAQASRNIKDAMSLVQTADGGLGQVNVMLIRLKELSEQAATGTYNATQREIISNEMQQLVSEIERAQKDLDFNGIRLFKYDNQIEIQSGEENEENILLNLQKITATTLGIFGQHGQKSYEIGILDGIEVNLPQVGADLVDVSTKLMADQTITIESAADVRTFEVSAALGNNNITGILSEIENLGMDGIREASAVSYANFLGFTKNELRGSYGDTVKFEVNIGGTTVPTDTYSFLIGRNEAETNANFIATLDRIVRDANTRNSDLDLSRNGTTLRSNIGKTIGLGNFELVDNPAIEISNLGNTPPTIAGLPPSIVSLEIDGREIAFEYSSNTTTNMARAEQAIRQRFIDDGIYYDAQRYANDLTYDYPHEHEHYYTVTRNLSNDSIIISKINFSSTESSTPPENQINIANFNNNQTRLILNNFVNYANEIVTLNIDGIDVEFTSAGTSNQNVNATRLATAINNASITDIVAQASGNNVIIARTNNEAYINIQYDDEDNNVTFSSFSADSGAKIWFEIDGTEIEYVVGSSQSETATNLEIALQKLDSNYTITRSGAVVRVFKNDNTDIVINNFHDDGINSATIKNINNITQDAVVSFTYHQDGISYPVTFTADSDSQYNAQAIINQLNSYSIPDTEFSINGDEIQVKSPTNSPFTFSSLDATLTRLPVLSLETWDGTNDGKITIDTPIEPNSNVSFIYSSNGVNHHVSFNSGSSDSDMYDNMAAALNALPIPNVTFNSDGSSVYLDNDNFPFSIPNSTYTSTSGITIDIIPADIDNDARLVLDPNIDSDATIQFEYEFNNTNYNITFQTGNTYSEALSNMVDALNNASIPNTTFTIDGNEIVVSNNKENFIISNSTSTIVRNIDISPTLWDGINLSSLQINSPLPPNSIINLQYEQNSITYNISFVAGNTEVENITMLTNALNLAGIPNTFFVADTDKIIVEIDNLSFSISDAIAVSKPQFSLTVTPENGSTAGSASGVDRLFSTGGASITVSDMTSSFQATSGPGSAGGGLVNSLTTSRTIRDLTTSINVTAGEGSTRTGDSSLYKNSGEDIGSFLTVTNSRASANIYSVEAGSYLNNTNLGVSNQFSFALQEDDNQTGGNRDHLSIHRINAGLRSVHLENPAISRFGTVDSQHSGFDPDAKWVMVSGTGEFVLDPNISFSVFSSVDGTEDSGVAGAFNARALEAAKLNWEASSQLSKGKISNFSHTPGETISFEINGVAISYVAGNSQAENSHLLNQALTAHSAELTALGISFKRSSNLTGVYLFSTTSNPITITNYVAQNSNSSGFDVWLIDSPITYQLNNLNSSVSLEPWISLSQINYRTQEGAQTALEIIDAALKEAINAQARLGADAHVLDNHNKFVEIERENTLAMISRITDADVAIEMTEFVKNQILTQAATAMLAQANSIPHMVLQLLNPK